MTDIHIRVLKFGRDNPGFTRDELKAEFPEDFSWIHREIDHSKLFQTSSNIANPKFYLSFDDRSKLLEYDELHDARRSSKHAMIVAIISILLTFGSIVYQFLNVPKVEVVGISEGVVINTFNKSIQPTAKASAD